MPARSTKVPVAHARRVARAAPLSLPRSPKMNSRDAADNQFSLGTGARGARAYPVARLGSAFAGQRAADWIVSPAGTET